MASYPRPNAADGEEDPYFRDALINRMRGNTGVSGFGPNGAPAPTPQAATAAPGQPQPAPGQPPAPAPAPSSPLNLDDYTRRGVGTGGAVKGALGGVGMGATIGNVIPIPGVGAGIGAGIGALVGGIRGAFTKHAASAATDFNANDARDAVGKEYHDALGRAASPAEIESQLRGQGLKAGDRYVGEAGLNQILHSIANSPEAAAFAEHGPASAAPDAAAPAVPAATPDGGYAAIDGFDFDKLSGKKAYDSPEKYSDAVRAFSKGLGSGVQIGRGNLDGMINYAKANGFANAKAVGDDKIDFGDGMGPIDVIRSNGKIWFQNGADRLGGPAPAAGAAATGAPGIGAISSLKDLQDGSVLQRIQAALSQFMGSNG